MKNKKILDFFDKIIDDKFGDNVMITKHEDGYMLFNRFYIKQHSHILYEVIDIDTSKIKQFSTLKYAMAYATLIDCGKYQLADRLSKLDLKINSLDIDLAMSKKLYRISKQKEIHWLKFHDASYNRKILIHEINELVDKAKKYQLQRFSHKRNEGKFRYWG
jgi:hypothetical protein